MHTRRRSHVYRPTFSFEPHVRKQPESLRTQICENFASLEHIKMLKIVALVAMTVAIGMSADSDAEKAAKEEKYGTIIGIDLGTTYSWFVFDLLFSLFFHHCSNISNSHHLQRRRLPERTCRDHRQRPGKPNHTQLCRLQYVPFYLID